MNFIRKNRKYISETAYILFFCLLFFAKGIGLYDGQKWFTLLLIPAVICWAVKMVLTGWDIKSIVLTAVLLVLGVLSWKLSGDKSAMAAVLTITGMKDVDIRRLWKAALPVWTAAFWGAVVLSLLGLWPTVRLMHHKGSLFILRDSLGMTHPNVLFISYIVFAALLFLVYGWNGRKAVIPIICIAAGGAFIFLYAFSYTGLLCLVTFLVLLIYFCFRTERTAVENVLLQCILPFCVFFSLAVPLLMGSDGPLYDFLYKVFNTRFYMTRRYLMDVGAGPFGKAFSMDGSWSVDCSYTYGILAFGVVLFVLILAGWFLMIRHMVKTGSNTGLAIALSLCVAGIMEPFMFNFSFKNLMYPMLGAYLYGVLLRGRVTEYVTEAGSGEMHAAAEAESCETETDADRPAAGAEAVWYTLLARRIAHRASKYRIAVIALLAAGLLAGACTAGSVIHYEPNIVIKRDMSDYIDLKDNYDIYGELDESITSHAWVIGFDPDSESAPQEKCYVFSGQPIEYITLRSRVTYTIGCGLAGVIAALVLTGIYDDIIGKKKN